MKTSHSILDLIGRNPGLTNRDISDKLKIGYDAAKYWTIRFYRWEYISAKKSTRGRGCKGWAYSITEKGKAELESALAEPKKPKVEEVEKEIMRLFKSDSGRKKPLRRSKEMYPIHRIFLGRTWAEWQQILNRAKLNRTIEFMELSK